MYLKIVIIMTDADVTIVFLFWFRHKLELGERYDAVGEDHGAVFFNPILMGHFHVLVFLETVVGVVEAFGVVLVVTVEGR